MSKRQWTEKEYRTATILNICPWIMIITIVIIGLVRDCIGNDIAPMDNNINTSREIVEHVIVVDSSHNGFRVVYVTVNEVTKARLKEIQSRPHIKNTFEQIKTEASIYFNNNLLETDIYDFAEFAVKYEPDPDIRLHNIFIYGKEKTDMYAKLNPKIENSATWINSGTEQGVQYLTHDDIFFRRRKENRIYRYWKCFGLNATSSTDEHYSHFSEEERLW